MLRRYTRRFAKQFSRFSTNNTEKTTTNASKQASNGTNKGSPPHKGDSTPFTFVMIASIVIGGIVAKSQYDSGGSFYQLVNGNLAKIGIELGKKQEQPAVKSATVPPAIKADEPIIVIPSPEVVKAPTPVVIPEVAEAAPPVEVEVKVSTPIATTPSAASTPSAATIPTPLPPSTPPTPLATPPAPEVKPAPAPAVEVKVEKPTVVDNPSKPSLDPVKAEETLLDTSKHTFINDHIDSLLAQTAATRRDIELSMLKDINSLDIPTLRQRLIQLSAEFFERVKWESLRLHDSLKQVETELTNHYKSLMQQQRAELQIEAEKANIRLLTAVQHEANEHLANEIIRLEVKLNDALRSQATAFATEKMTALEEQEKVISAELIDRMNHEIAVRQEQHAKALLELNSKASDVLANLQAVSSVLESTHQRVVYSATSHLESAAILALERALRTTEPLQTQINSLQHICKDDAFTTSLLAAIPSSALQYGLPSALDLRSRFNLVRNEVRKIALAPANAPSLVGVAVGSVLAKLSWAPSGFVPGEGIEETLARANYLLDHGDVAGCLKELDQLHGLSSVIVKDWMDLAEARVVVEKVADALRTSSALRHVAYANAYFEDQGDVAVAED